jgi:hypothetical protein
MPEGSPDVSGNNLYFTFIEPEPFAHIMKSDPARKKIGIKTLSVVSYLQKHFTCFWGKANRGLGRFTVLQNIFTCSCNTRKSMVFFKGRRTFQTRVLAEAKP